MKIDGLGILLVIIIFPVILVVSYYIQLQVKTISKENSYNTKLLNATYDAISAFELNTANEELSNVSDSMRSIIEASNNTFFNTLATNLGMSNASKEMLQPYVPAVLYTLYDGYYIYAPSASEPVIYENKETSDSGLITTSGYHYIGDDCDGIGDGTGKGHKNLGGNYGDIIYEKDGGGYTVNRSDAKTKEEYILKPYTQYSAKYKAGDIDITVNYTLDNYLNIEGKVGEIYYTKTGYLIKDGLVSEDISISNQKDDGNIVTETYNTKETNEDDIKNKILGKKTNVASTNIKAAYEAKVTVNGKIISAKWTNIENNLGTYKDTVISISEVEELIENEKIDDLNQRNNIIYEVQKYKAIAYYASAACFSNWVYDNLRSLKCSDIKDEPIKSTFKAGTGYKSSLLEETTFYTDFSGNTNKIFDKNQDPELSTSNFNTHKLEVIKNSIKYNLNLVISNYKNTMNTSYKFSLPIIEDSEWDKILSNISIVSFMQGFDCGLNVYNNYEIASSTNNELMVNESEIYYVPKGDFNFGVKDDVSYYYHRIDCPVLYETETETDFISFTSKEIKYDKIYNSKSGKYEYDHRNLACYSCINTGNYNSYGTINEVARLIGIGCQRQGLYKINAPAKSEGYKSVYYTGTGIVKLKNNSWESESLGKKVKEIEITIENTSCARTDNGTTPPSVTFNGGKYSIFNSKKNNTQHISIDVRGENGKFKLKADDIDNFDEFSYKVVAVKYIYN